MSTFCLKRHHLLFVFPDSQSEYLFYGLASMIPPSTSSLQQPESKRRRVSYIDPLTESAGYTYLGRPTRTRSRRLVSLDWTVPIDSDSTSPTMTAPSTSKLETYGRYSRTPSQALASTSPPFPASTARRHNEPFQLSLEPISPSPSPDITNRLHDGWGTYRQSPSLPRTRPHFDSQDSLGLGNYPPLTYHWCESDSNADSLGHQTIQPPAPSSIKSPSAPCHPPLTYHWCESAPDANSLGRQTMQPSALSSIESRSAPFDASVGKELKLLSAKLWNTLQDHDNHIQSSRSIRREHALRAATRLSEELKCLDSLRLRTRRKQQKLLRIAAGTDSDSSEAGKENQRGVYN